MSLRTTPPSRRTVAGPMSARLAPALDYTLRWEGGFSDHSDDPGGRTKYGISERAHPEVWQDGPPALEQAHDIYRREYWSLLRCGDIGNQRVATYLFDTGVNQGVDRAGRILQRSCVLLGEDIAVDGMVGPQTLGATNRLEPDRLLHVMMGVRVEHHVVLAQTEDQYRSFLYGWLRRDFAILGEVD